MALRVRAVVFDLDGTLVDSAISIAVALNRLRARRGVPTPLDPEDVKRWVSLGAETLVRNALADAGGDNAFDLTEFRAEYATVETPVDCLYPGVLDTLRALASSGLTLGICSNKPQLLCEKVLQDTGVLYFFSAIVGGDAVAQPKPNPAHLLSVIDSLGAVNGESVYIGDSSIDVRASEAAGVPFVLARYGYADRALLEMDQTRLKSIASLIELPALLASRIGVSTF